VLKELIADETVRTEGERRGTRYFIAEQTLAEKA
jgi:hypothetical protein